MKRSLLFAAGIYSCLMPIIHAEDNLDRLQRIANELSGEFSGKQQVKYTTVLFVAKQQDNKFPSYWAGRWGDGNLVLRAEFDPFDEQLQRRTILADNAEGEIVFDVSHPAAYQGLEDKIPTSD